MKKTLFLILLLTSTFIASAQKFENAVVLNYLFDFSLAKVEGVDLKEYYTMSAEDAMDDPDEAFRRFAKKAESTFILSANKNSLIDKGYKLDNKDDLPFEVVIYPMDIDDDGAHNILGIVIEKATKQEIARVKSRVGGGRMNDFQVLFLENLQKSGERFGDKLADDILDRAKNKGRFATPQGNW